MKDPKKRYTEMISSFLFLHGAVLILLSSPKIFLIMYAFIVIYFLAFIVPRSQWKEFLSDDNQKAYRLCCIGFFVLCYVIAVKMIFF